MDYLTSWYFYLIYLHYLIYLVYSKKEKSGTQPNLIDFSSVKEINVHESKDKHTVQDVAYKGSIRGVHNGDAHRYYDVKIIMQCVILRGIILLFY